MERSELLEALVALARDAGITVRTAAGEDVRSGSCRVRGQLWLVLAGADTLEDRIAVVAAALREHCPSLLDGRYLPPAVRERLENDW